MKSQAALEYLIIVGIAVAAIVPFFYYSFTRSSDSIVLSQAQDAVGTLAKATDYVYSLGTGSSTKVTITIPKNVVESSIQSKVILLRVKLSSGISDIKATTKADVFGNISTSQGTYNMFVNMTGTQVEIKKA